MDFLTNRAREGTVAAVSIEPRFDATGRPTRVHLEVAPPGADRQAIAVCHSSELLLGYYPNWSSIRLNRRLEPLSVGLSALSSTDGNEDNDNDNAQRDQHGGPSRVGRNRIMVLRRANYFTMKESSSGPNIEHAAAQFACNPGQKKQWQKVSLLVAVNTARIGILARARTAASRSRRSTIAIRSSQKGSRPDRSRSSNSDEPCFCASFCRKTKPSGGA